MPRNYWKWTAPLLCVSCLSWGYSQDDPHEVKKKPVAVQSAPGAVQPALILKKQPHDDEFGIAISSAPVRKKLVARSVPITIFVPLTDEELARYQEYYNAVAVLKSDEPSDVTRKQAKDKLVEALGKMMDADLEDRKEEVTTLEKRVTKMRAQFDMRKAAQDRIIDLRMKTIQNQVDGLGGNPLPIPDGLDVNFSQVEMNDFGQGTGSGARTGIIVDTAKTQIDDMIIGRTEALMLGKGGAGRGGSTYNPPAEMGGRGRDEGFDDDDHRQTRPTRSKVVYRTIVETAQVEVSPAELAENQQYESSLKVLKSVEGDAAKETARNTIRQLLVTRFTRDIESREKSLVELESRVKKLREQLDKRIAARDQIIDLQMTTLQNEIDGLGFDGFQTSGNELGVLDDSVFQLNVSDVTLDNQPAREGKPARVPTASPYQKR